MFHYLEFPKPPSKLLMVSSYHSIAHERKFTETESNTLCVLLLFTHCLGLLLQVLCLQGKGMKTKKWKKQGKIKPMITQRLTHQCSQQVVFNSYKTGNSPNSHIRRWMHKKTAAYLCLRIPLRNKKEDSNVCNRTNDPQDNVEWKKSCKKKKNTVLFHLCKSLENANQSIVTQGSSPVAQC